jgi:plasmid maintenance system antidote protein VapI
VDENVTELKAESIMHSKTDLINNLRIYGYSLTALASDLGITKSYLSKIINKRVSSLKYEKLIDLKIRKLLKTKPKNINKDIKPWSWRDRGYPKARDLPLRNEFQTLLDRKNINITELSKNIGEARSSVSQVIIGLRHTQRIIEKLAKYFGTDPKIYLNRCAPVIVGELQKGILLPLGTDSHSIKIKGLD